MKEIHIGKWTIRLPDHRLGRIIVGVLLVISGLFGFLPVLGFWMIPLGLLILSYEIPAVRRARRRLVVWLHRRWPGLADRLHLAAPAEKEETEKEEKTAENLSPEAPERTGPAQGSREKADEGASSLPPS